MTERRITDRMLNAFETMLKEDEKSKHTVEKYMRDVRCFQYFAKKRCIDKTLTIEYKSFLEKEYATASANSMIAALNSFLRFIGWDECCIKQFKVQKKTYCSENDELTKAEYLSLVRAAESEQNERLSLLIQTICGTGIRVSEVEYITVEAAQRGEEVVSCKGKTRIFVTKNGKALNRSNIWREMKNLCKQAGVSPDKVFPHNLRHLFARTFYGIEKDIAKLADILGHSSINTTRIYIVSTGAEHKRRIERMHLIL